LAILRGMTPAAVASALEDLEHLIAAVPPALLARRADSLRAPRAHGAWSALQELGHLVDSALNNIQRLVRLQATQVLDLPGYDSDAWVAASGHAERAWPDLVATWIALNRHLLHIGRRLEPAALAHVWLHDGQRLTLAFIVADYVRHLREHLEHIVPGGCAALERAAEAPR
jgi:hypothetical protein